MADILERYAAELEWVRNSYDNQEVHDKCVSVLREHPDLLETKTDIAELAWAVARSLEPESEEDRDDVFYDDYDPRTSSMPPVPRKPLRERLRGLWRLMFVR